MSEFVHLVNVTDARLSMVYDGAAIVFQPAGHPGSLLQLPTSAAEYIKGHLRDQVRELDGSTFKSHIERPKIESFYVANMSGNPDAPEFFEEEFYDARDQEFKKKKTRNELKLPQNFRARLGSFSGIKPPGTLRYKSASGEMVMNSQEIQVTLPGKMIEIPAYGRVEVSKEQFETLLGRDHNRPDHLRGQLIRSRPYSEFEPDYDKHSIDELRMMLELVPSTADAQGGKEFMGPSEDEIRKECVSQQMTPTQIAMKLHQARFELWARCALRSADPQYAWPQEKDFNAARARKAKTVKAEAR